LAKHHIFGLFRTSYRRTTTLFALRALFSMTRRKDGWVIRAR